MNNRIDGEIRGRYMLYPTTQKWSVVSQTRVLYALSLEGSTGTGDG
jgi:hypothetical protein